MNKWPKEARCRLVPEPRRAESSSPQALHQADSISLGSEGNPKPRMYFLCSSRAVWAHRCTQHSHALIAPFPVGNSRKKPPPVPRVTGEFAISPCSWEDLLAVPGFSPPQRGPRVPVLRQTGDARPSGDARPLGAASRRCSDTSLMRTAGCIVSPGAFAVRGFGGTSATAVPTRAGAGHQVCFLAPRPGVKFHSHSLDVI